MGFHDNLRAILSHCGGNMSEVARITGLSANRVRHYLKEGTQPTLPKIEQVEDAAKRLGLSPEPGKPTPTPKKRPDVYAPVLNDEPHVEEPAVIYVNDDLDREVELFGKLKHHSQEIQKITKELEKIHARRTLA